MQGFRSNLHAFPQTLDLLQRMHNQGLKLVIATSAEPDELNAALQVIGPHVSDLFSNETSFKNAKLSKPDSDVVQVAIQKADLPPQERARYGIRY